MFSSPVAVVGRLMYSFEEFNLGGNHAFYRMAAALSHLGKHAVQMQQPET
jgi:hypothetical protein